MTGNGGRHSEQFRVVVKVEVCLLVDLIVSPKAVHAVRLGRAMLRPANGAARLPRRFTPVGATAGASATVAGIDGHVLMSLLVQRHRGRATLCEAVRAATGTVGDRTRIAFSGSLGIGGSKRGVVERAPQRGVRLWETGTSHLALSSAALR
jgi:hypothetical protein